MPPGQRAIHGGKRGQLRRIHRNFPLIGSAQIHHRFYKCNVSFTETIQLVGPAPQAVLAEDLHEAVFVDHRTFVMVSGRKPIGLEINSSTIFASRVSGPCRICTDRPGESVHDQPRAGAAAFLALSGVGNSMKRGIISTIVASRRRRLRFRLRTLLILTPIVGCLAGGWIRDVAKTVALSPSWFDEHSDVLLIHDDERLVAGGDAGAPHRGSESCWAIGIATM